MPEDLMFLMGILEMAKRPRSVTKRLQERVKAGKCIECDDAAVRCGKCFKHYQRDIDRLMRLPNTKERTKTFADKHRRGEILKPGEIRELKRGA
jgi:hypothetical protein